MQPRNGNSRLLPLLINISNENITLDQVKELNLVLQSSPLNEKVSAFEHISFEQLIEKLDWNDELVCVEGCKLLEHISLAVPSFNVWQYSNILLLGLDAKEDYLIIFSCKMINRQFREILNSATVCSFETVIKIISKLILLLGESSTEIFSASKQALHQFFGMQEFLEPLLTDPICKVSWVTFVQARHENRLRLFELVNQVSRDFPQNFPLLVSAGLLTECLQPFLSLVESLHETKKPVDPLVELNLVELLGDLAEIDNATEYLRQGDFLSNLSILIADLDKDPLRIQLVLPGYVKFLGRTSRNNLATALEHFPTFANLLSLCLTDNGDLTKQLLAIETLAFVVRDSYANKQTAETFLSSQLHTCLTRVGELCAQGSSSSVIRQRAFDAWRYFLECSVAHFQPEISLLCERWFHIIVQPYLKSNGISVPVDAHLAGQKALQQLRTVAEQPFLDLRSTALRLFTALSCYPWALLLFQRTPGFQEYLLNRKTELEKAGRELKFELIKSIVQSPASCNRIFDAEYVLKLREYVMQGPFYIRSEAAVIMDDAE